MIWMIQGVPAQLKGDSLLINTDSIAISTLRSTQAFSNDYIPQVAPYPALAREFQKYIGYPVSLATGTPNINIPLFDVKVDNYSIPFSLNYHSSGIKVTQSSGLVGYGWTLMPSFRITRVINNKPDEADIKNTNEFRSVEDIHSSLYSDQDNVINENIKYLEGIVVNNGKTYAGDTEYDIFTIQLPACTGSFILQRVDNKLQAVKINSNNLKITPRVTYSSMEGKDNGLNGFEVMDENGIIYKFGEYAEQRNRLDYLESSSSYTSSWMLYKIVLPSAREIIFNYTGQILSDHEFPNSHTNTEVVEDMFVFDSPDINFEDYDKKNISTGSISNQSLNCIPKSITFPSGSIKFEYERPNSWLLNKIVLSDSDGVEVKKVTFQRDLIQYRRLASVSLTDGGTYHFEYNATKFNKVYDQDYWGYNNGSGNSSLEPRMTIRAGGRNTSVQIGGANRAPSEFYMKAHILEKITYPTGGYTSFDYEANRYYDGQSKSVKPVGGLRIKEMKTYDSSSGKTIKKTYKYGLKESGYGKPTYIPKAEHFLRENYFIEDYYDEGRQERFYKNYRQRVTSINSYLDYYFSTNTPIWYDCVTEYSDGGKTVYEFEYVADELTDSDSYSNGNLFIKKYQSYMFAQPELKKKSIFNENNPDIPVKEIVNTYVAKGLKPIQGIMVKEYLIAPSLYSNSWGKVIDEYYPGSEKAWIEFFFQGRFNNNIRETFSFSDYEIQRGIRQLSSTQETDYTENGKVIKTTAYSYDDSHPYNLKVQQNSSSRSASMITTRYYYPYENIDGIDNSMLNLLINNNRYSSVIQKEISEGSTFLSAERTLYKNYGNNLILPEEILLKQSSNGLFENQIRYDYDIYGNLLQYTTLDGISTSYLWSYNGQYPVAEIKNATYEQVRNALNGQAEVERISNSNTLSDADSKKINDLRNNNNLKNALITTYIYKPLVGVETITDPRGITTTYEYDEFGRLKSIKDSNGHLIEEYKYHYREANK